MDSASKPNIRAQRDVVKKIGETSRNFPSFDNLAAWAVNNGHASSIQEVRESARHLWGDLLFEWYAQGQIACMFAIALAQSPDEAKWFSAVIDGPWDADIITGLVDGQAESGAQAIQLLFPGEGTAAEAIDIIRRLAKHPRWSCVDIGWLQDELGDTVQIGLRWVAPDGTYESWALGIGCFEPMPFTRRFQGAPFVAVVLRPSPPAEERAPVPLGSTGLKASHLAHMDDRLGDNEVKRKKWNAHTTNAKRALILPDHLSLARAKVTFAFPSSARAELCDLLEK